MRYLCLIHLDEQELAAMPADEASAVNAAHWELNDRLRESGKYLAAEALAPAKTTKRLTRRGGQLSVLDGPFAETKEVIAGFYLIDAHDMNEAIDIASRLPSAPFATIEVRPCRQLEVIGQEPRWG
jgi:hypothetical protein